MGHPCFRRRAGPIGTRRTALAGDTAALVDLFLGEGIYYAIRSGHLAARAMGEAADRPTGEARAYPGSFRWHLLGKEERPHHDCAHSRLTTFARGLATVVVLRKCCSVDAPDTPCLPGPVSGQGKG